MGNNGYSTNDDHPLLSGGKWGLMGNFVGA